MSPAAHLFVTFAALFGILVLVMAGALQLAIARRARRAGDPKAGAMLILAGTQFVLAALGTILLLVRH